MRLDLASLQQRTWSEGRLFFTLTVVQVLVPTGMVK